MTFRPYHDSSELLSPLTGGGNILLETEIDSTWIIENYKKRLATDVREYFAGTPKIKIFRCLDSGLRFYYPFHLAGKSDFYERLSDSQGYYTPNKWEFEQVADIINPTERVLDVGCGQGDFLNLIRKNKTIGVGIDLNRKGIKIAEAKGLMVFNKSLQEYANEKPEPFDIVCLFQVIEHITEVANFIRIALQLLKPGGRIFISTPNNNKPTSPLLKNNILDMPPHHMNLWDLSVYANITRFFSLRAERFYLEPLQKNQYDCFAGLVKKQLNKKWLLFNKINNLITAPFILSTIDSLSPYINGQTILVEYKKI